MTEPRTFAHAARWSFAISVGQYGTLLGLNLLLARLLGPEAFGLVAMATVYVLFVQLLLQQGMMPAIIQRPQLRPAHLDSAFWLVMAAAVVLTGLTIGSSGWWADVNHLPELQPVIVVLSLILPLRGLCLVQEAILRRDLDFKPLALRTGLAMTIGGLVAVVLAVGGAGAWSLVAQQVTTAAIEVVVLWRVGRWRPRLRFERACATELLGFSGGAFLGSVGVFANTRADTLITGLFFGPVAVGWYRMGTRLTTAVIDLASRSLQQAALPDLARLQHDPDQLRRRAVRVLHISALAAVPTLGVLAASAEPLLAVLGPEWVGAAPSVEILCWWAASASVMLMTGAVLQASGRPYLLAGLQWVAAAASFSLFLVVGAALRDDSVTAQVTGIAAARALLYSTVLLAMNALVLRQALRIPVRAQLGAVTPSAIAGLAAYLAGVGVRASLPPSPAVLTLAASAVAASAAAVAVLAAIDPVARALRPVRFPAHDPAHDPADGTSTRRPPLLPPSAGHSGHASPTGSAPAPIPQPVLADGTTTTTTR